MGNEVNKLKVIEQLISSKLDFTYTANDLRVARERISLSVGDFYHQIRSDIIIEDQKGNIVDEVLKEAEKQKNKDFDLLDDIKEEINKNITNLEEQVEEVRKQSLTFYYKSKWD